MVDWNNGHSRRKFDCLFFTVLSSRSLGGVIWSFGFTTNKTQIMMLNKHNPTLALKKSYILYEEKLPITLTLN